MNEQEIIRLLFALADIQQWINELTSSAFSQLPHMGKRKLQRAGYYLGINAMAHILERHYHKVPRHPGAGKFCISVNDMLWHISEARKSATQPVPGHATQFRIHNCNSSIGYDRNGQNTSFITVFTDAKGNILTAFPGQYQPSETAIEPIAANTQFEPLGLS